MKLNFRTADFDHVPEIVKLKNAVSALLTEKYGKGHWSYQATEKGVRHGISNTSVILIALTGTSISGMLRLAQKKPWAIDASFFTECKRPLYLLDMAVAPKAQGQGIGRALIKEAMKHALAWPADMIRLDAYDTDAGAGEFYSKCGFREVGRVVYRKSPLIYFEMPLN